MKYIILVLIVLVSSMTACHEIIILPSSSDKKS